MPHDAQNWIGARHICIKHSDGTILADDVELTLGSGFDVTTVNAVNATLEVITTETEIARQWNGQTAKNEWKAEVSGLSQYLTGPWLAQKLSSYNTSLYIYNKNFPDYKIRFIRPSKVYGDQDYFPKCKIQCMVGNTVVWDTSNLRIMDGYESGQHYWSTWAFFLDPATMQFYPFWSGGWDATNRWYTDGYIFRYNAYANLIFNIVFRDVIPSGGGGSDPYEAGGYSDTTPSSSGDFDDASDSISVPSLPSISALGAGAVSLAVISEVELKNFMDYIMNPSFTGLSSISRFFSDPIKAIACLNYMPYTPTNTSGYTLSWGGDDTGASVGAVSAQYEEIDCGSVSLSEFYGSCLDYSPYTTVQLVLPFAGSVDIDPDEFNGKTISVKYHIDNYTGAGLVLVSDGDRVLLQVPCSVSNPIPLTSTDYSAVISAIANVVMGGVSTIAAVYTGGASVGASVALAGGFAASAAGNVMSAKLHYNHGGSMGMGTGMFGVLKPYLIIKRPRQCLPEGNGSFQGYPTFVTENLGDLSGFTKIAEIHLDSIPVTTAERAELLAILKGGVIF